MLSLDPTRPIYLQIMEEVKKRAVRGEYPPGVQLPSVREFAKETGVNPNTIARVYMELEREGFIVTHRGQGTFVTNDHRRIDDEREKYAEDAVRRFADEIASLGLNDASKFRLLDILADRFSGIDTESL